MPCFFSKALVRLRDAHEAAKSELEETRSALQEQTTANHALQRLLESRTAALTKAEDGLKSMTEQVCRG